jgi:serine/threonine-protein kinase
MGNTTQATKAKSATADDATAAGFNRPAPQVGSDVLTPPPASFSNPRPTAPNEGATWGGGANAPTYMGGQGGANAPTYMGGSNAPTYLGGSNAPTIGGGWGAAAAPAMGGTVDFGPRYRVEKLLGQGGMGAVYKAYDQDLDRTVALKLVRPELMVHPEAIARFKQELLLASKISHRNILRIHDLGDASGMKFISMAFVEGEDLHQVLLREGKLPLERMLHITKQLCGALEAAHSEHVVHRDLKPQNIMLGPNDHVYVSDFGLAKSLGAVNSMTQSGEMLGTPRYMAPEQVEAKSVDARTDIYALGLIFYEMVTGDVPFTAETTLQLMYKRAHEAPPPPKTVVPDLPDWLNNVIMKCLERDPVNRYQSTRDILTDIESQNAPKLSPQPSVHHVYPQVAVTQPASRKTWIGIVAAILVLTLGLLAVPQIRHAIFKGKTQAVSQRDLKIVAVLPLRVTGDEKELGYIAEGVTEALSAKLSQVKGLSVVSSGAIEKIGNVESAIDAGKALGASFVFSGSLQGSGSNLRILISMTDVARGIEVMPPKEFSGVTGDLLTLEDNIYGDATKALQLTLTADEMAKASAHPTERIDAYQSYLHGRNSLRGKPGADVVKGAITDFDKALKADPMFALAYTGIADASLRMYRDTKEATWAQKAVSAAEHASQLASDLPEVNYSLGSVYVATGKTNEAVAVLQNAVNLAPNSDEGYRRLGDALKANGKPKEAIVAYGKAIEINPYYWYNFLVRGNAYNTGGQDDQALYDYNRVIELAPKNAKAYSNIGAVYIRQGKWNEAVPPLKKATDLDPTWMPAWSNLGNAYFYLKNYDESAKYYQKAVDLAPNSSILMGNLAEAYRWKGDKQQADAIYDKAIALAQKEAEVNPRDITTLGSLALFYAKKGSDQLALQYIRRARSIDEKDLSLMYNSAIVNTIGGRPADALKDLKEAVKKGYPVGQIKDDPDFQALANNAEFAALIKGSN